ncbi:TVP38/TMEM64 family protein [Calycomorphotria hydatis]|uniref:SNARE associated Golgi protein n=1 Tax=Calycomorphotria hydatis TaxID=2528027 RepID=A0A517T767_9PLAN|nr:VTT domain-containing protein [Calycomorphotria hydatis]QDT64224.1 SNARE associated Golgi protein [Calycomorphotria hydatis]
MSTEPPQAQKAEAPEPTTSLPLRLVKLLLFLSGVLAVPILPLFVLGLSFEEQITESLQTEMSPGMRFFAVIGVLAVDILLPVPSSVVSTYAGGHLGLILGTIASFTGMTLGAAVGYILGRWGGAPLLPHVIEKPDQERIEKLLFRIGPLALFITRPLPILAEAAVLLCGAGRLPSKKFWPTIILANLLVSFAYVVLGNLFGESEWWPLVLILSALVPLLLVPIARRGMREK